MRRSEDDPEARMALVLLRYLKGWDQQALARAAGISKSQVSVYDRGERAVPRAVLERAADAAGLPRHLLAPLLHGLRSFRAAAHGRSRPGRALGDELAGEMLALGRSAMDAVLSDLLPDDVPAAESRPPCAEDRTAAAELWARLARRTPAQRLALIEEVEEFQTWALAERAAAESLAVAPSHPRQALELADLACRIAELAPGTETWRRRLQGFTEAHLANARRACNDIAGAEEAMARARKLWEAGEPGDPGLLDWPWR